MSEPNLEVPVVTPTVLEYRYQPKDEFDRPMGGIQVIKYTTQEELTTKLVEQNSLILRQLRKVNRDQRLGITHKEEIPTDAAKFDSIVEFKPRNLTPEDRFNISQDLNDPEKFQSAADRLLESAVGVPTAQLRKVLNDQQLFTMQLMAKQNYDVFATANPAFYACDENKQNLTDWMWKNELAPTVENFTLAYSRLQSAALLVESPAVRQEPVAPKPVESEPNTPQVPVVSATRISPEEQPQAKRQSHIPSGLNERTSSASGVPAVEGNSMTLADIEKLPADVYKQKLKDPAFRQLVDKLDKEAAVRRQARINSIQNQ